MVHLVAVRTGRAGGGRHDATFGAEQAARQLGQSVGQVRATLAQLAASPSIVQAFGKPAGCQLSFGLSSKADAGHLDLVRPDGTVACSSRPPASPTDGYAGESWLADTAREVITSGPRTDRRTGHATFMLAVPVPGHGMVVAFVDLSALGTDLGARLGGPDNLVFLVLSRDGATVFTRSAEPAQWIGKPIAGTAFSSRAGSDVDGVRRVYGRAAVPDLGWQVHVGAARADVLAGAHQLVRRQSLIPGAGLSAGLVATWLVYRRITRPIKRLSTAVRAGATGTPIAIDGPREVAGLGSDFNQLVAEVNRELEERRRGGSSRPRAELPPTVR